MLCTGTPGDLSTRYTCKLDNEEEQEQHRNPRAPKSPKHKSCQVTMDEKRSLQLES